MLFVPLINTYSSTGDYKSQIKQKKLQQKHAVKLYGINMKIINLHINLVYINN